MRPLHRFLMTLAEKSDGPAQAQKAGPVFVARKVDSELQILWSEVYTHGFPDSQGDFMSEVEVRKMGHSFMARGGSPDFGMECIDINHDGKVCKAVIVESFIARKGDPDFLAGAWVVGIHVQDWDIWNSVKKGELNGLSMEALVYDDSRTIDVDLPGEIDGLTMGADLGPDHIHVYKVMLDSNGQIVSGNTDVVNGHSHMIKRGTMTEVTDGHKHRFSFLDELSINP